MPNSLVNIWFVLSFDCETAGRFGMRHFQALLLFLCLTIAYAKRVNLTVGLVAMTDRMSSNPDYEVSLTRISDNYKYLIDTPIDTHTAPGVRLEPTDSVHHSEQFLLGLCVHANTGGSNGRTFRSEDDYLFCDADQFAADDGDAVVRFVRWLEVVVCCSSCGGLVPGRSVSVIACVALEMGAGQ